MEYIRADKTYSFYVPAGETPIGAKVRFEKAISEDRKKASGDDTLKQIYASELAKVDPSKIGV